MEVHKHAGKSVSFRRKMIPAGNCRRQKHNKDIFNPEHNVSPFQKLLRIIFCSSIIPCSYTLPHNRCNRKASRRSRNCRKQLNRAGSSICRNACSSKTCNQGLGKKLTNLEHGAVYSAWNTQGKDFFLNIPVPAKT